jgi:hypothetical protein
MSLTDQQLSYQLRVTRQERDNWCNLAAASNEDFRLTAKELDAARAENDALRARLAKRLIDEVKADEQTRNENAALRALLRHVLDCDQQAIPGWLADDIKAALSREEK